MKIWKEFITSIISTEELDMQSINDRCTYMKIGEGNKAVRRSMEAADSSETLITFTRVHGVTSQNTI
jgi:hypothetical protein